jgi:hypothetical protein
MVETKQQAVAWPWPAELDGPIAAPDQHNVLFENDRVRVLETTIRVGEVTPLHTHGHAGRPI